MIIREDSQCPGTSLTKAWHFYVNTNSFAEKLPSQTTEFPYVSYKLLLENYEFVKGCLYLCRKITLSELCLLMTWKVKTIKLCVYFGVDTGSQ